MPIRIPDQLPATEQLESENIFVMTEHRAMHQDIRPLRVLLLNLMPKKIETETQIMRKLSNTPLQIEVELLHTISHESRNVSQEHLKTFYRSFDQVKDNRYDGMIITGAPVELHEFEDVDYWDELCRIMKWSTTNVHSTLHICWGAQAGIFYHYGIQKHELPKKLSGVFNHDVLKPSSPLVRGFDDRFWAPHSRHTTVYAEDIEADPRLEIVAQSDEAGVYIAKSTDSRHFFVFGHPEYDTGTLRARREQGHGRPRSGPLLPQRRPRAGADQHVARARAAVVHQLAELLRVPDHALRPERLGRWRIGKRHAEALHHQTADHPLARQNRQGAVGWSGAAVGEGGRGTRIHIGAARERPLHPRRERGRRRLRPLFGPPARTRAPVPGKPLGLGKGDLL